MHLERNLNPTLSKLYLISGAVMILLPLLMIRLLPGVAVAALVLCGALSILSGYLHH